MRNIDARLIIPKNNDEWIRHANECLSIINLKEEMMTNTMYPSRLKKDLFENFCATAQEMDVQTYVKQHDREVTNPVGDKYKKRGFVVETSGQNGFEVETENNPDVLNSTRSQQTVSDHRQGNRHRSLVLADIYWRVGQSSAGLIYDLSPGGMFVVSRASPDINKLVAIVLSMPGNSSLQIPGLVVHCRKHGFGLLFQQLDHEARAFVQKYLS